MDLQKMATYGTAVAVVGTGSVVGGVKVVDNATGGPEKRLKAESTELRIIVREEVQKVFKEAWPQHSGPVVGQKVPTQDYRQKVLPTK